MIREWFARLFRDDPAPVYVPRPRRAVTEKKRRPLPSATAQAQPDYASYVALSAMTSATDYTPSVDYTPSAASYDAPTASCDSYDSGAFSGGESGGGGGGSDW